MDVPPTLSARTRPLSTGGDRKTNPADALHIAQVALFPTDLPKVTPEEQSTILRLLTERHNDLVNEQTRIINPPPHRPSRPASRRRPDASVG
ncbi:transposase [Streptomyces sp. NPDC057686]|uniref:IS110 family transposase n=1 Tax=Streptomyces sp. NPDC057686 TaxID=3346212 RepID=UPI003692D7DE